MEFDEPKNRRSSEPSFVGSIARNTASERLRGCLLKNYFNVRKRSLIRTESEDSGFSLSLESALESVATPPSIDAERCLEELGFAGATDPLIPDRFIPSLMHRISNMPDEVMMKLSTRVWKSIDTFTKNDHVSLLFRTSCAECDLCVSDLKRSYSCTMTFPQETWYPDNMYVMADNGIGAARVQSWLSRFPDNAPLWEGAAAIGPKANIGHIGNQSSTESGILSIIEDDEGVTASNSTTGRNVSEFSPAQDCADDSRLFVARMESSRRSGVAEKSETGQSRTRPSTKIACEEPDVRKTALLSSETSAEDRNAISCSGSSSVQASFVHKHSPMSPGRRSGRVNHDIRVLGTSDAFEYDKSRLGEQMNPVHTDQIWCQSESVCESTIPSASSSAMTAKSREGTDHVTTEGHSRRHSFKKMSTDGQLFLLLRDLEDARCESVNNNICSETKSFHFANNDTELKRSLKDNESVTSNVSALNSCYENQFDATKKRHSLDAAFACSAAERRERYRLSHTKSQNFLFEIQNRDRFHSRNSTTNGANSRDSLALHELQEEVRGRQSPSFREVHFPEEDNDPQDISGGARCREDNSFGALHNVSNIKHVETCSSLNSGSDSESSQEDVQGRPPSPHTHEYENNPQDNSVHTRNNEEDEMAHIDINATHVDACSSHLFLQDVHWQEQDNHPGEISGRTGRTEEDNDPQDISGGAKSSEDNSLGALHNVSNIKHVETCSSLNSGSDSESSQEDVQGRPYSPHTHKYENNPQGISIRTRNSEVDEMAHISINAKHADACSSYLCLQEVPSHEQDNHPGEISGRTRRTEDHSSETSHTASNIEHVDACSCRVCLQEVQSVSSSEVNPHQQDTDWGEISSRTSSTECDSSETSHTASNVDHIDAGDNLDSQSDSESSEQYFSCDEISPGFGGSFADDAHCRVEMEIPRDSSPDFTLCLTSKKRSAPVMNISSKTFSKDGCSRDENSCPPSRTFNRENLLLHKILKHNMKLSILGPTGKMVKHFAHEKRRSRNDGRYFSQDLSIGDTVCLPQSKILELRDCGWTYNEALLKPCTGLESIATDKAEAGDNTLLSKPFVRDKLLRSNMSSPKCEVRLIDYDGSALFWSGRRNSAERNVICSSYHDVSMHSDPASGRTFTSGVYMSVNSGNEFQNGSDKIYFTQVYLEVNGEEARRTPGNKRFGKNVSVAKLQDEEEVEVEVQAEVLEATKTPPNTENPCGRALKDLEDLRVAIQKAKETRVSASRELKLLQELLQGNDNEEDENTSQRMAAAAGEQPFNFPVANSNQFASTTNKALSELQQKSEKGTSQNKEFWEEEIKKAKEEISQVCEAKLNVMEEKLRTTEEELERVLDENGRLKDQLELSAAFPVCKCNADAAQKSDFSHMNGISHGDPTITSATAKPSLPTRNFWQEWDRLQSDLMKAERKADELNILLNQKLIELNKMQLMLSKQTKEMILLEKAYFQLRSHLLKRRRNKSHQSLERGSPTTEGASDTSSSKASEPEIPP